MFLKEIEKHKNLLFSANDEERKQVVQTSIDFAYIFNNNPVEGISIELNVKVTNENLGKKDAIVFHSIYA